MSDQPSVSATGKSQEEVAFDLVSKLKGQGVWGERNIGQILDMYAECLIATKGQRIVEGLKAAEQPLTVVRAQAPAPARAQQAQAAPTQTASPVHAQQQAVQQAFKQA